MNLGKSVFVFFMAVLLLQSCAKEDDLVSVEDLKGNPQAQNGQLNQNGNGQNGNGQNGQNGQDGQNGHNGPNGGGQNNSLTDCGNQFCDLNDMDSRLLTEWTELFLDLDRYATGMRPTSTARALAYINLASYEAAVPGMVELLSNTTQLSGLSIDESQLPQNVDYAIAINAAYSSALDHFLINLPTGSDDQIFDLEDEMEERLSRQKPQQIVEDSKAWGVYVANQVIAYSQTDVAAENQINDAQPTSYVPPVGDGYWTFSAEPERALFPYWGTVRTFAISANETTTLPPLNYSTDPSSPYYQEMVEVYNANNDAAAADGEQLWIAEFWSDDVENLTFSPPARQFAIANQLVKKENVKMQDALLLYLKLGFSLNDAAVATWKYKYEHMVMRPSVFIQDYMDADYQTNLYSLIPWPNPTFPAYPSGHSTFASAGAGVFIDYFGNQINFTDRSHQGRTEFRSQPRNFNSFEEMAVENAFSRIPLGVHMRMDCVEGLRLGYEISAGVNAFDLSAPGS